MIVSTTGNGAYVHRARPSAQGQDGVINVARLKPYVSSDLRPTRATNSRRTVSFGSSSSASSVTSPDPRAQDDASAPAAPSAGTRDHDSDGAPCRSAGGEETRVDARYSNSRSATGACQTQKNRTSLSIARVHKLHLLRDLPRHPPTSRRREPLPPRLRQAPLLLLRFRIRFLLRLLPRSAHRHLRAS